MRTVFLIGLLVIVAGLCGCKAGAPKAKGEKKEKIPAAKAAEPEKERKAGREAAPGKGEALARIGDTVITEKMLDEKIETMPQRMRMRFQSPMAKKNLLNSVVEIEVLYIECKRQGLDKDEAILAVVEDFKKNQAASKLREKVLKSVKVEEAEVREEYEKQIDRYKTPKRIKISQIVFDWDENATPKEIEAVEDNARKILERVKKGEDFAELASKYSLDQASAKKGGDIGFVNKRLTPPHVYEAAMVMEKAGDASGLVKGERDILILKATEVVPEKTKSFEDVKAWLERSLSSRKQREAWTKYVDQLKEKANVEVYEDRLGKKEGEKAPGGE